LLKKYAFGRDLDASAIFAVEFKAGVRMVLPPRGRAKYKLQQKR
jgi:hypothetical protein